MSALAFADPALELQAAFRAILRATASPGAIETCGKGLAPPSPLSPAAAAVLLTLADFETPLWLAPSLTAAGEAAAHLKFHTGAPLALSPRDAAFALIDLEWDSLISRASLKAPGLSGPLDHCCRTDAIACAPTGIEYFRSRRAREGGNRVRAGAPRARSRSDDERGLPLRSRHSGAGGQAGAWRPDRGNLSGSCLSHDAAAPWLRRANRHRRDDAEPPRFRDVQGPARRADAGADVRLLPSPDRLQPRDRERPGAAAGRARSPGKRAKPLAACHRSHRARRSDRARERARAGRAGFRHHPRRARFSRRPIAKSGARRRGLPAGARLRDPARLRPHASVRRRDFDLARRPSRCSSRISVLPFRSATSQSPNVRWSTSSSATMDARRFTVTASPSGKANARPCRWRSSISPCAPTNSAKSARTPRRTRSSCFALRQRASDGLHRAPQASPLRRFPIGAGLVAAVAPRGRRGGRRVTARAYNFVCLDEHTNRMIRRAILKAIALPGYQVPFASPAVGGLALAILLMSKAAAEATGLEDRGEIAVGCRRFVARRDS